MKYPAGIMKPDITFFGEKLTDAFDHALEEDRGRVDLLLVIGTSLKVSPVAEILCECPVVSSESVEAYVLVAHLPHSIPQVLERHWLKFRRCPARRLTHLYPDPD